MRRHLAIVNNPVFGGGTNQPMVLAQALREQHGWETHMRVPDLPEAEPTLERLAAGGVPVGKVRLHRLRRTRNPVTHATLLATLGPEVRALRRLIRDLDVDLVQAFGPTNPHLALAGHLEGRAVVWTLYDTVLPPRLAALPMQLVKRIADVVLPWGQALADAHPGAASLGDRCIPVFPTVDLERFRPDLAGERRAAARAELGLAAGSLVVGTLGNRNPTKGHDHLVRALRLLGPEDGDVHLCVLGQPSPVHAEHMAMVDGLVRELGLHDRVRFVDPGSRVPDLLPAFDVFAMGSVPRSEGVPTALLEAMACGLPVVATDVGAIPELVQEGVNGHVVPSLDDRALAAALRGLLDEPDRRRAFGAAGRRRAEERHGVDVTAAHYARAFQVAVEHRAGRRIPEAS